MDDHHVYILLGTFNGSRHIGRQLESIRAQTFGNWTLLVRDDGSHDDTIDIVRRVSEVDSRVEILPDDGDHLGCASNFSRLATEAFRRGARYAMFSDQDDVWFPKKVEDTLRRMVQAEGRTGPAKPVLVHTDLDVVDSQGLRVHRSFMGFQKIHHPFRKALRTLLVQNFVTGCTAMANRPLLEMALPIPRQALMHDWWFALCAASAGSVEYLRQPTMSYRRHGDNAVTVRGFWGTLNPYKTDWRQLWGEGVSNHRRAIFQAEALLVRLSRAASSGGGSESLVQGFVELHDKRSGGARRILRAMRLALLSQSLPRTAVLYLRLLWWADLTESVSLSAADDLVR